jgi:hypothetical protein
MRARPAGAVVGGVERVNDRLDLRTVAVLCSNNEQNGTIASSTGLSLAGVVGSVDPSKLRRPTRAWKTAERTDKLIWRPPDEPFRIREERLERAI